MVARRTRIDDAVRSFDIRTFAGTIRFADTLRHVFALAVMESRVYVVIELSDPAHHPYISYNPRYFGCDGSNRNTASGFGCQPSCVSS